MPIPPPPPPPPGGPPPAPTLRQANTTPPKLTRDEAKGRGALLSDICKGAKLKNVGVVNDRSAPMIEKPKVSSGCMSTSAGSSAPVQPVGGLFQGGVPKLRPVGDGSVGRSALHPPGTRSAAPRPPGAHDDTDSPSQQNSPPESSCSQRPSLPDLSRSPGGGSSPSTGMKHSSSAPPLPPPMSRRGNAPPAPPQKAAAASYNREKPLPPTPGQRGPSPAPEREKAPPPPVKPPPSPLSSRSSSSSSSSLAPPPPPYRQQSGVSNGPSSPVNEAAPELPQRHNSLSKKPSVGGHTPTRGHAPPPPPSPTPQAGRPAPPAREPPGRGAAPPVPGQPSRNGRDALPPPPPYRGSTSDVPSRGKPPPPPSRTPAGPPPPPPPIRNGHTSISRSFVDDFESKYSFHPLDDFPPPEEYRHFTKIYPSKANRVMRGAPPLPPVGR
ncbi:WAS/WASL-interacting protein family member 2-like isoform X2 [Myxocyprinus asiaticus]|uniref:WAS/WASL-interacting protein family member 2-like isoform X2 n=1 Tax=Myxocyprinus asiaticus TaxID=70543 RepID=UPI00222170C6|nr:WAS/WASL-interacting protein family member 2-like isoform X2 [Myxocyprinus asiaticus]